MNTLKLAQYQKIIDNYGPWSAHNVMETSYIQWKDFVDRAQKNASVSCLN